MIIQPLSDIVARIDQYSAIRLNGILKRSIDGVDADYRTPLYGGAPRDEISDLFEYKLGKFGHPEMDAIDQKEKEAIGVWSRRLPWTELRPGVELYFKNDNPMGNTQAFEAARTVLMKLLPRRSLRLASIEAAVEQMPKRTNLGAPTFSSDEALIPEYVDRAKTIKSAADIREFIVFWRGQPNGTDIPKQRTVMGGDHLDTICWERVLIPLLPKLRVLPGFAAWNDPDTVDNAVTELLKYAVRNKRRITSGDHSKYDCHLSANIINVVFDFLENVFQESDSWLINILREEFLTNGLITPDGIFNGRIGSVMSGSGGTNLVDSVGDLFACLYVAFCFGCKLLRCEIMGDDFVAVWSEDVLDDLEDLMATIGLETNKTKQFDSYRSCHFLQKWHSMDYQISNICRGVRSPFRILNGALSHERRTMWNEYMDETRWIMQFEMGRWDKRFVTNVKLLREGSPHLSEGMDPVTLFKLAGGASRIRQALRIQSYPYNAKNPEGVESFSITQVLRRLG